MDEKVIESNVISEQLQNELKTVPADSLRLELEQSYKIINALSSSYHDVYYADIETGKMRSYRYSRITMDKFGKQFEEGDFETNFYAYVRGAVHPDDQELFEPVLTRSNVKKMFERTDNYSFNYRAIRQNGEIHYCQCQVVQILGQPTEFVFAFRNIDREMVLENEKQSDLKRRMDIVMSMVKVYDNSVYVNVVDNSFMELKTLGYVKDIINPCKDYDSQIRLVIENTVYREHQEAMFKFMNIHDLNQRLKDRNVLTMEFLGRTLGWSEVYLIVGSRDEEGNVEDVFFATRNINDEKLQKLQQQELERSQTKQLKDALRLANATNRANNTFLNNVSHDIRMPLDALSGLTTLALDNLDDKALVKDHLMKIMSLGRNLTNLLEDVLDLGKIQAEGYMLPEQEFDLKDLLQESMEMLRGDIDAKQHDIKINIAPATHVQVVGAYAGMKQIFVNLISNMVKYTPEHGQLSITIQEVEPAKKNSALYEFTFTDNGVGIASNVLASIFKPFNRHQPFEGKTILGTGLGLTIVSALLKKINGNIQVESELGKGSTFKVYIILRQLGVADKSEVFIQHQPRKVSVNMDILKKLNYQDKRVLLVEDHEINAEVNSMILAATGLTVDVARNGQEAVDMMAAHPYYYYDLILMDIRMPVMDGYKATKIIRGMDNYYAQRVPIVALTANTFPEDVDKVIACGMNEHIAKPLPLTRLADILQKWLD